nr:MAG TPA: hypothetical protein [Caudoviricetes sp.]
MIPREHFIGKFNRRTFSGIATTFNNQKSLAEIRKCQKNGLVFHNSSTSLIFVKPQ